MPSYLAAALQHESFRQMREHSLSIETARPSWPVNEVVLNSMILAGKDSSQIADEFGVSVDAVSDLRAVYEL